uniref:Uncharacterized protein n=1 Tax=Anguilla anguilla TaxID=7936 RepID=A0A0E9WBI8_ANGAN
MCSVCHWLSIIFPSLRIHCSGKVDFLCLDGSHGDR